MNLIWIWFAAVAISLAAMASSFWSLIRSANRLQERLKPFVKVITVFITKNFQGSGYVTPKSQLDEDPLQALGVWRSLSAQKRRDKALKSRRLIERLK